MNQNIQTRTVEIFLDKALPTAEKTIDLPDGEVTHIGLVKEGAFQQIVNLEVLQNNSRVIDPCDIRFSERTASGNFLDTLRPVGGIKGGRVLQVRLSALNATRATDLTVQVLFVIQQPENY